MDEFKVTIEQFDGPMDLMLHLIKENQLDLMDLDVNILTDQYIAYLQGMNDLHLEVASEYLVELATLIEYKSKKMLPGSQDELEDGYEEDPKERLVKRLLEYQQFKEASADMTNLYEERQKLMSRPLSNEIDSFIKEEDDKVSYSGNPYDLMKAMRRCLMRLHLSTPTEKQYTVTEVSIEDRELVVRSKLDRMPEKFKFEALLDDVHDMPMFIATFLSILDLARMHTLVFTIDDNDVIWFSRGEHFL
ncbi:MAG: segregation/condensation protein A [Solobacterium sp.]|nr:segregation/condensation protein A [Solobacterium sp.]MCH4205664.1 segregation/condensation protein A [Solobacterium sp.]MCH4227143.1 segregation/condensation protein A [Solobacterium sp.]MCH4282494.1 segregation/condensation protein A [Solobacterium sp.]